jgi:hypothetical protein
MSSVKLPKEGQIVYLDEGQIICITFAGSIIIEKGRKDLTNGLELMSNVKFFLTHGNPEKLYYLPIYKDDYLLYSMITQLELIKMTVPQIVELFRTENVDLTGATFFIHCIRRNVRCVTYVEPKYVPNIKTEDKVINNKILELKSRQKFLDNNRHNDPKLVA